MKIVVDDKIPYIRETLERLADEVVYRKGVDISPEDVRGCFHVSAVILPAFSTMSAKNWSSLTVATTAILSANFRRFAAGVNPMCFFQPLEISHTA